MKNGNQVPSAGILQEPWMLSLFSPRHGDVLARSKFKTEIS
jgi:hypothetical protein